MFQDTTRLRLMSRPSMKEAIQSLSAGTKLGRLGISQSFRERLVPAPIRPRDPPPPPPPSNPSSSAENPRSLAKKLFSFNKSEIKKINKFLGIRNKEVEEEPNIYDIAEDEAVSNVKVVDNAKFYAETNSSKQLDNVLDDTPLKLKTGSRPKRERSKSFTPRSRPLSKAKIFNRSMSQISNSVHRSSSCRKLPTSPLEAKTKRTLSSSDLVHIFPDEERRSFKDIRKILSSPSISSGGSTSSGIYRPKSQLSTSSSVINSIKEEQVEILPAKDTYSEHIYEEINDRDLCAEGAHGKARPLPPIPAELQSSPARSSPILSDQSSPVKSIFEGASKYDILNYLEDARERGLTDCDLDLEEEDEDEGDEEEGAAQISLTLPARSNTLSSNSSSEEQLAAAGINKENVNI